MFDPKDHSRIINFRPLFIAAVGLMLGISGSYAINTLRNRPILFAILLCVFAIGAAALLILALRRRNAAFCILLAAVLIGAARMGAAAPSYVKDGNYTVSGTVYDISDSDPGVVTLTRVRLNGVRERYRLKLKLEKGTPKVGQTIEAECSVNTPHRRFGTYNERSAQLANGISLYGSCKEYTVVSEHDLLLREIVYGAKLTMHERIYQLFGRNAPIAAGFLLGERSGMDEADEECFSETGTAHLLTLSGFHVAVLTGLLFLILPKRFPLLRFIIVSLFLLFYCAITAFAPSLVRASLMCICVMTADIAERRADPLSSLSLAAVIILLVSPYKLYSLGFRLSFAATFGILLFIRNPVLHARSKVLGYFLGILIITFAATAATSMFVANAFGELPTYGVLSNITAVPLFSVAIPISFAALIIGLLFPVIGKAGAFVANILIDAAMRVLGFIMSLPHSSITVMRPSALSGVLLLVLMFTASPYVLRPAGKKIRLALPVLLLFTASIFADIIRL